MSLLELLLVVGLLATLVAISWPALRRPMNRSFVQSAAQDLQRDLLAARFEAMDQGVVRVFQFQSGTTQYWIGETIQDDLRDETFAGTQKSKIDEHSTTTTDIEAVAQNLPEGTIFQSQVERLKEGRDSSDIFDSDDSTKAASLESRWSKPVRFYPSGRMDSAKLVIESDDGYVITIDVQGLAGRIRLTDLRRIAPDDTNPSPPHDEQKPKETRRPSTPDPVEDEQ